MGLDIVGLKRADDDRVSFSYGGFADFRRSLAKVIGIDLDEMAGFGGEKEWPSTDDEPLVYLLNHSDCDGTLDYEACDALAVRLREVVLMAYPDEHVAGAGAFLIAPFYRDNGLRLADLCSAVSRGDLEELLFS